MKHAFMYHADEHAIKLRHALCFNGVWGGDRFGTAGKRWEQPGKAGKS